MPVPFFPAVDLAKRNNLTSLMTVPPTHRIGTTYFPAMNAMKPAPLMARALSLAAVQKLTGAGASLPDSFNWADPNDASKRVSNAPPGMIMTPGNQGQCGSCYAFSSCSVLADRWAIATRQPSPSLSVDVACSCWGGGSVSCCGGGNPYDVGTLFETQGVPSTACVPYSAIDGQDPDCGSLKGCADPSALASDKTIPRWYAIKGSNAYLTDTTKNDDATVADNIQKIKSAVYASGPVVCAFWVMADFMEPSAHPKSWPGGIYKWDPTATQLEGGHAVTIVGYGPDYWVIRNSWDVVWNDHGFCKVYDGLHGNKMVGFDHGAPQPGANDQSQLLGGAYVWLADPKSGVGGYSPSFFSQLTSKQYLTYGLILLAIIAGFLYWRKTKRGNASRSFRRN